MSKKIKIMLIVISLLIMSLAIVLFTILNNEKVDEDSVHSFISPTPTSAPTDTPTPTITKAPADSLDITPVAIEETFIGDNSSAKAAADEIYEKIHVDTLPSGDLYNDAVTEPSAYVNDDDFREQSVLNAVKGACAKENAKAIPVARYVSYDIYKMKNEIVYAVIVNDKFYWVQTWADYPKYAGLLCPPEHATYKPAVEEAQACVEGLTVFDEDDPYKDNYSDIYIYDEYYDYIATHQ